jgi:alpha-beta hydrolase superfamily lysophospholipase
MISSRKEFIFESPRGHQLHGVLVDIDVPQGLLCITHGQGEYSGSYHRLIKALEPLNLRILLWDMYGHGKSQGKRGTVPDFEVFVEDQAAFLELSKQHNPSKGPVFTLGHSLGALVLTKCLLMNKNISPTAVVLSAPFFGLGLKVPLIKDLAALALGKIFPSVTLGNEIPDSSLTRDPEVLEEYSKDMFRHHRISPTVYLGSLAAHRYVQTRASEFRHNLLMQIPEIDPVVSSAESIRFFENSGSENKTLKVYPDRKHEIYNDLERELVFKDLRNFLSEFLK